MFFKSLESSVSSVAKVVGGRPCKLGRGRGALTPIGPEKIKCILLCISDFHVMKKNEKSVARKMEILTIIFGVWHGVTSQCIFTG